MGTIEALLAALGLNKASLLTGALGALIAALKAEGGAVSRVINFTAGFFFAAWGSGIAVSIFSLPESPTFFGALGFALGYLGMAIMDAAMLAANSLKTIDWKALIERVLSKVGL